MSEPVKTLTPDLVEELRKRAVGCELLGDDHLDKLFLNDTKRIYYRFLYFLVRELQPDISVELGIGWGGGTAHLAAGWPEGRVFGVDHQVHGGWGPSTKPYDNIALLLGSSDDSDILSTFEDGTVDLCFVDSMHAGTYVLREVELWTPKMREGGIFVFDDLDLDAGMKTVLPTLPFKQKDNLPGLHYMGFGYAIVEKR